MMETRKRLYIQPSTELIHMFLMNLLVNSPGYSIDYDDNQDIIDVWQQGDDDEDIEID